MSTTDRDAFDPEGLTGVSRRTFLRYTGTLSVAAALTAGLAACSSGPKSTNAVSTKGAGGSAPNTIEATLAFELSSGFDPMNASSAVATCANQHIFEALVDLDPISRKPYLALAKEQPKESNGGKTWTVTLRDGAKFSDGSPVTAEDVAWSFTRANDPKNAALMALFIPFIDRVEAKDKTTAVFHLKTPFSLFPERIAVIKIVPKALTKDAAASKKFDNSPVGSGPFKLDSVSKESGLTLSANSNYNGPRPAKVDKMTWGTTTEASTRIANLTSGRVQAIEAVPYLNVSQLEGKQFQVDKKQAFNLLFLMFNCSAKPFDDKRVRQALFYALDTEKIIKTALQGYATPATSYLDEGNAGYQRASTVYTYNPDKAKALLKQAGVRDLTFELVTTDTSFIKDSAPLIVESWKNIGVTAKLNTVPSAAVYGDLVPKDSFRALAASGDPTVFGPDVDLLLRWFYYGAAWPKDRYRWDPADRAKAADWIDQAARETDPDKQKQIWKQVLDFVAEEVPLYPVYHTKTITGSDPKQLSGFQGAATTGLYFLKTDRTA